jgi:hypothetical protein
MADDSKVPTEHPSRTIAILAHAAESEYGWGFEQLRQFATFSKGCWKRDQEQSRLPLNKRGSRMAIAAGIAELFAYRLSKAANVRVAPVRLKDWNDEPKPSQEFIRRVPGGWCVSERVERALPIYYLRGRCEIVHKWSLQLTEWEAAIHTGWRESFDKKCPVDRSDYSDFPDRPSNTVLAAARWNSPERLLGHAYRAFLYASHAHTSNALVDLDANVWLIDHEHILYTPDTADVAGLHTLVKCAPGVMRACRQISSITPDDIEKALDDIPISFWDGPTAIKHAGAVFTTRQHEAADYFINRLEAWQKCFPPIERETEWQNVKNQLSIQQLRPES